MPIAILEYDVERLMSIQPFALIPISPVRSVTKPRVNGLTMMMDWGLPLGALKDWLGLIAPYVDSAKFVAGTARLYDEDYLRKKISLYEEFEICPFIGGQFLEYVFWTKGMDGIKPYCVEARRLGFTAIEVSDNCVPLSDHDRRELIGTAIECGLSVHGEVGSKSENTSAEILIEQAEMCFDAGAECVLVEGAEFIKNGILKVQLLNELKDNLDLEKVMFELSGTWISGTTNSEIYQLKSFLIKEFGSNVNIANILPENVWETEALRVGLSVGGPPSLATNE